MKFLEKVKMLNVNQKQSIKYNALNMNSIALDRPYQAERTAKQTPRANGRGICQAVLFIFIVMCFFNCIITVNVSAV